MKTMSSIEDQIALIGLSGEDDQDGVPIKPPDNSHDHCLVTIEEHSERKDHIDATKTTIDSELAAKVPPLPEGKDKHLFVSHSSDNFEDVMEIVNQLEQRFNVSCIISDRDFEPGKDIFANIKGSMKRSLKNVFMLTPEFVQSGFCKFERDMAFMTSVESGISTVIPVLLQECNIPTSLVAVTYIDGTYPGVDIPAKIIQALIQSELAGGSLLIEDHTISKKYENAFCVAIPCQKKSQCFGWKPSQIKFKLSEDDLAKLRHAKINLPGKILTEAFNVMNRSRTVQFYDCTRRRRMLCLWNICTFPLWFLAFTIVFVFIFYTVRRRIDYDFTFLYLGLAYTLFPLIVIVISIVTSCILPRLCNTRKQEVDLQMAVWDVVGQRCIQHNTITLVERKRTLAPTQLYVMRYNIGDCKTYLAGLIRSKEREQSETITEPEVRADEMIDRAITRLLRHLSPGLEELPDAPYNRHNVRKSKMCLCQLVEAGSPLVNETGMMM